jgi:putative flippase GtrA
MLLERNEHTLTRATVSSLLATAVDALAYQLVLFILVGRYEIAAACAAVAGAVTNFLINRHWTFSVSEQRMAPQAFRYAIVSLLTLACLSLLLWVLVDILAIDARIAWLPAKILAFLIVSFPLQRIWVFKTRSP